MIPQREAGRSGIRLSRIGFGGAPLGDLRKAPTSAGAEALLNAVWDRGIRYFDTAPFYGSGLSERRLGDFLRSKPRDSFVLSTKVGRLLVPDAQWARERWQTEGALPFRPVFDFSYDGIMKSFEQSLQRLGLERIDIVYLHDIGRFSQKDNADAAWKQATEGGGLKALTELRRMGAVRAIGAGVNEAQVINDLLDVVPLDIVLLANRYTLLDQRVIDTLFPRLEQEGVGVVIGAPLNSGILLTGAVPGALFDYGPAPEAVLERTRRIEAVCRTHGVSLLRAAVNFPLGHRVVTTLIPGPARLEEFEDNLQHLTAALPEALWAELRQQGLIHQDAPSPLTPALSPA